MRIAIDVVFLDRRLRVRKIRTNVPPRRIAVCLTAESVLELPAGAVKRARLAVGDELEFTPNTGAQA